MRVWNGDPLLGTVVLNLVQFSDFAKPLFVILSAAFKCSRHTLGYLLQRAKMAIPMAARTKICMVSSGLCLCLLNSVSSVAESELSLTSLQLNANLSELALAPYSEYLEDAAREITLQEILSSSNDLQFSSISQENINFGFSDSVFWVRTPLNYVSVENDKNLAVNPLQAIIHVGTAYIDLVDFYWLKDGELIKHVETGDQRPFAQRGVRDNNLVLPVSLEPGSQYVLLTRFSTDGSAVLPLSIWERSAFDEFNRFYSMVMGGYYGVLFVMLFYNFFIWLSTRQDSYLSYLVFAVFLMFFQLGTLGHGYELLWRDMPWIQNHIIPFSGVVANLFALRFAHSFLEVKRRLPKMNLWVNALSVFMIAFLPFTLIIPNVVGVKVLVAITGLGAVTSICCGVSAILDRVPVAKYYLLAWVFLLSSAVTHAFTAMGFFEANIVTTHAILIGSLLELVLFSLALGERFSIIQRQSQTTLQVANHELKRSNRLKDEFLSTISHELRTPINGIQGALDLMEEAPDRNELKDYLKTACHSTDEMLKLVDNILVYSETVRGTAELHIERINLSDLRIRYQKKYSGVCDKKGLNFIFLNQDAIDRCILTDTTRLEIMLNQLIDNAIKYTEKGTVSVSINLEENSAADSMLEVLVEDTGVGISTEDQKELFLSFRQKENSHSRQHQGLGIGLSIVKDVVKDLGGAIDYHSSVGVGTQFVVKFPVKLVSQQDDEPAAKNFLVENAEQAPLNQALLKNDARSDNDILVVEDNPVNQKVLVGILKKLGYRTLVADNGEMALSLLAENSVDLILMDCQMPVMDGFAATQAIRALPPPKNGIPIIAVTANAMSSDERRCLEAGMDAYMKKPVKKAELHEMIQNHLNSARDVRQNQVS